MLEIRKARAADAERILEYCKLIGGESDNLPFGPEGVSMTVEREQAYLESIADSATELYLVAVEDGEVVGVANIGAFGKPRLSHKATFSLSVRKAAWGKGIGTKLMERMLDFARQSGTITVIGIEVRSDNHRAIALYKKYGFETIGTFEGYMNVNGEEIACDIMRLHL